MTRGSAIVRPGSAWSRPAVRDRRASAPWAVVRRGDEGPGRPARRDGSTPTSPRTPARRPGKALIDLGLEGPAHPPRCWRRPSQVRAGRTQATGSPRSARRSVPSPTDADQSSGPRSVTIQGEGDPADRGDQGPPGQDRQHDQRPPRAAGRRQESNPVSSTWRSSTSPFFEALDLIAEKAAVSLPRRPPPTARSASRPATDGGRACHVEEEPVRSPTAGRSGSSSRRSPRSATSGTGTGTDRTSGSRSPGSRRLRPMLLSLKAEGIQVMVDDRDKVVPPAVTKDESGRRRAPAPRTPSTELNINLDRPRADRGQGAEVAQAVKG